MPGPIILLGIGTMLDGIFAAVNDLHSHMQTKELEEKKLASLEKLAQINEEKQFVFQAEHLALQRQRLMEEMKLQRELASEFRQFQLLQAREQREASLKIVEEQWRMENWPLKLAPVDILGRYPDAEPYPLKVFLAPPALTYDTISTSSPMSNILTRMENSLNVELQKFLQNYYPPESTLRPVEFIDGAWSSKQYYGRSSAITLYNRLKSEPTMILELINTNTTLHLKVAYWSISSKLQYNVLAEIPLHRVVQDFARKRIEGQKQALELLFQQGNYDIAKSNRLDADLRDLEQNEQFIRVGANPPNEYVFDPSDIDNAVRVTVNVLFLITAWFADVHHLFSTEVPEKVLPQLPRLLGNFSNEPFIGEILRPLLPEFDTTYRRLTDALKEEQPYCIPAIALHLAEGLSVLPEKIWAERWIRYALVARLETLGVGNVRESQLLDTYLKYVDIQDVNEIALLKRCFANLEDHKVARCLGQLESNLRWRSIRRDDLIN